MEENKLEIVISNISKKLSGLEAKNGKSNIKLSIKNKETSLTEMIIQKNIQFKNLKFKIILTQLEEISNVIKNNYLQEIYPKQQVRETYLSYTSKDFTVDLPNLFNDYIYKVQVNLTEKINSTNIENILLTSNSLIINPVFGIITQKKINQLYKDKFHPKKYLSKSEKDNLKAITNEMRLRELDNLLDKKDIKSFTYEGRTYQDMNEFVNSKYKSSKLMTEKRKKKILFSTHSDIFFNQKMELNEEKENPFLKNSWFMGPIYSYDFNYNKYK